MAIVVGIVGLTEANKALRNLPELARDEAQRTMDVTAFHFARMAAGAAPRRTGNLASDISWASRPKSLSAVVMIHKNAYYWRFQEFGTAHHGAQPFMRPTAVRMRPDHDERLRKGLAKAGAQMARQAEHG